MRDLMKFIKLSLVALVTLFLGGCSVYMASHQPSEKNVGLFKPGTPRSFLIAEFGVPVSSEVRNGQKFEIFRFTQGYSGGAKAGRAFAEGVADVMTLGAAEIITTPVETIADGNLIAYEVSYDNNDLVVQVISLTPNGSPSPAAQPTSASTGSQQDISQVPQTKN
jgi:hypothetical protein